MRCLSAMLYYGIGATVMMTVMSGCIPSVKGGPERAFEPKEEARILKHQMPDLNLPYYYKSGEENRRIYRNQYITSRMAYIDIRYFEYERDLAKERQGVDFLSAMSIAGLTSADALVASAATKSALAQATALINAGQTNYNEKIQFKQTLNIFINQMKANRAKMSSQIYQNLSQSDADYPLPIAMSDLEQYYQAGTLAGALASATQDSARLARQQEFIADKKKEEGLRVVQGYAAETNQYTDIRFFTCVGPQGAGYSEQVSLINEAAQLIRSRQTGHIDYGPWRAFDELSQNDLKGKITIVVDAGHPERTEGERYAGYLKVLTGSTPVVVTSNRGKQTPWMLSIIVCP